MEDENNHGEKLWGWILTYCSISLQCGYKWNLMSDEEQNTSKTLFSFNELRVESALILQEKRPELRVFSSLVSKLYIQTTMLHDIIYVLKLAATEHLVYYHNTTSSKPVSSLSTHLCLPEDIFHSCGPRLCQQCSSTSPVWGDSWARADSPLTQTPSRSIELVQLETLTEETEWVHLGKEGPLGNLVSV